MHLQRTVILKRFNYSVKNKAYAYSGDEESDDADDCIDTQGADSPKVLVRI